MNKLFLNFTLTAVLLFPYITHAQKLDELQRLYPDKLAVFSNINRSVEIFVNKESEEPFATVNEVSEMMILNDKANGLFNKDKVYHSSFNELKRLDAYTILQDGTKVKVTDYKVESSPSQGVFYDDVKQTAFDYPRLTKGSVAHVETDHYNKDIRLMGSFYFSSYLPVHKATYTVLFPDDMDVKYIIKNDYKKQVKVTESKKGRRKKIEFTAAGIDNYEVFGDGTSIPYYALHVIVYAAGYTKDGKYVPVFNSVDQLYKWNSGFLKNINAAEDESLQKIADSICRNKKTEREKAQAIYRWVQEHIKYVAFEEGLEGFVPRQAIDVCNKRYGDCKDMASLLTALLRASGMKAYFTWIGTRSIPYTYSEVPLPLTDNHMICAVQIDKDWIFLDATDLNCIFGMPTGGV